jgi:hypothetical protein
MYLATNRPRAQSTPSVNETVADLGQLGPASQRAIVNPPAETKRGRFPQLEAGRVVDEVHQRLRLSELLTVCREWPCEQPQGVVGVRLSVPSVETHADAGPEHEAVLASHIVALHPHGKTGVTRQVERRRL